MNTEKMTGGRSINNKSGKDSNLSAETVGEDGGRVGTECCEIAVSHTRTQ